MLRRLSLSGKERRTAIYLSTSPGCLVAQPVVFVSICNNEVIRMAMTSLSFRYYPDYFLYYLCYSHTPIFRESIRQGLVTDAVWDPSWLLCHPRAAKSQSDTAVRPFTAAPVFVWA